MNKCLISETAFSFSFSGFSSTLCCKAESESADVAVASQGCGCRRHHRSTLTREVFGRWCSCGHEDKLDLQSGIEVLVALNKTFSACQMIYFEQSVIEHRSCTLTVLTKPFFQTFVSFHPFLCLSFSFFIQWHQFGPRHRPLLSPFQPFASKDMLSSHFWTSSALDNVAFV